MASGFRYPIELFAIEKVYRFPVLAHWSFTTNEGATFESLMHDLDVGLLGTVPQPDPKTPPAPPGPEIVETGHIGLDHRTRRGDSTRAWYRGPLVPFPTERNPTDANRPMLAHSADQIRRIVPDGREDLSLAAAFEIGRLLGLSQLSVVSALLRFRNEQFGAGRVREILSKVTDFKLPEFVKERIDLGRFVAVQMIGDLAKNPADMLGPRRPIADPGRELVVRGELDAVIAQGLGFNLEAVRKRGQEIGIVAALSQAQVPIANREGQVQFDKNAMTQLRGALSTELNHVLNVALPKAGQRTASASDALDDLIQRAPTFGDDEDEEEA
jgi:hypothetical protein